MPELSAQDTGPVVAAFDFDSTLTRRDTFTVFLARGLGWPRFVWALLRCSPWLAGYALRIVPNHVAKGKLMQATLAGRSLADLVEIVWETGSSGRVSPVAVVEPVELAGAVVRRASLHNAANIASDRKSVV